MRRESNICLQKSRKRIVVLGDVDFAQATNLLQGVIQFAEVHSWDVIPLHYTQERLIIDLIKAESVDGVIGAFPSDRWIQVLLGDAVVPVVNTSNQSTISTVSSVIVDDSQIGRMAAGYLLDRQFDTFAYGGMRCCEYSDQRCRGFAEKVHEKGFPSIALPHLAVARDLQCWIEALEKLARPAGVFCASDFMARRLILAARRVGTKVPEEISVVGVGDSAMDSLFAGVGITSVALPCQAIGYKAAQLLSSQFDPPVEPALVRIAPAGIVSRASTGMGPMNALVGRALIMIERNLALPELTVAEIAHKLRASRRLLEIRFREALGRPPHAEITRQRMALARSLLLDPRVRIADICINCGYTEISHFYHRFKVAHATTPAAWRRAALALNPNDNVRIGARPAPKKSISS